MQTGFPFDAVLFDLDGTLVATDRFWVQAARTGARRAFAELGLVRALPSAAEWMGLVGQPLEAGFAALFADLAPDQRAHVQARCVEEEHRLLDAGGAAWMPGGEDALAALVASGVRIGVASNCTQAYLEHMLGVLGVGRYADEARCLDSPGVRSKADMIEDLLETFETRCAVFVGDRVGDRDSAWANAIPHVHCAFGFAGVGEAVRAEATIEDLGELVPRLAARSAWVDAALARAGLFLPARRPPFAVGVTGLPLAGKSLFASEAVRCVRARGGAAAVAELAWFREADAPCGEDPLAGVDLARLERELLAPLARGERLARDYVEAGPWGELRTVRFELEPGGLLFVVGEGLLDPRVSGRLERTLWLEIDEELVLWRAAGREGRRFGPGALGALRAGRLAAAVGHRAGYRPDVLADLVLSAYNPLGGPRA